jgi:hypothetical protein
MNGHEKNSHTTIRLKRRLGWLNAPNYYVEIKRLMLARPRSSCQFSMHARGDRVQINSLRILAQIIRPTRIHYTFVGDELATTFGLVFCG